MMKSRKDLKAMQKKITYKDAGVDIDAADEFIDSVKQIVKPTFRPEVLTGIGGFGSQFALNMQKYREPVLVSSTDGVGTKLRLAFMMNRHDTIGIDLVAMCANDIIVQGAEPLFMLDYLSIGRLDKAVLVDVVRGIAGGCKEAGCSLVGGETAEMPSFYADGEYDMAGFVVGAVERENIIDGSSIAVGDTVIGIASSGVHSNGLSLARKVAFDIRGLSPHDHIKELGCSIGEELLRPTRIYVKTVMNLMHNFNIRGIAHITGGGLVDNVARILPQGCRADIRMGSWEMPPVFGLLQQWGGIEMPEMFRTFNCGIGLVLVVGAADAEDVLLQLHGLGEQACVIGTVVPIQKRSKRVAITSP
jgi:phosphoribosylformylglycinamidine cyclo-ligase